MAIELVRAIPVAYPEPNDYGATRRLVFACIIDSSGATGWGEAVTTWEEATAATAVVIEGLGNLVKGRDATNVERIWADLRARTGWYGRGGIASLAISAIDMAVWDLRGKLENRSVTDLLGGAVRDRLPVIASAHAVKPSLDEMADEVGEWVSAGFQGYKFALGTKGEADLGHKRSRDLAYLTAIRERIGDAPVMVDVVWGYGISWDYATAVDRVKRFAELGVFWIEEPLNPADDDGYRRLRAATDILIAYGEREFTIEGYDRLLRYGSADVVGVDPGRCEGITGARKVIQRVEAAHAHFNAHTWSSALNTAASIALSATTERTLFFEMKPIASPMQDELVTMPIRHQSGWISPPTGPGLGVEIREEVVEQYRIRD